MRSCVTLVHHCQVPGWLVPVWLIARYLVASKKDVNDPSTHKWMVYVRGPNEEPRIDHFVDKVIFLLHDSYKPKNIVTVTYVSAAIQRLFLLLTCLLCELLQCVTVGICPLV